MGNLKKQLDSAFFSLAGDDSMARIHRRAVQVRDEFRTALEWANKGNAPLFLDHINAVYITNKEGDQKRLIVYLDDSSFAAELNAQRELIKGFINGTFHEGIEIFEIHISRKGHREKHPYLDETSSEGLGAFGISSNGKKISVRKLSENEEKFVEETSGKITDKRIHDAFLKAMTADLKRELSD